MMKQIIIVNEGLKLPKGKLAAQVAHASVASFLDTDVKSQNQWVENAMPKIILKVLTHICNIGSALHCSQRTIERSFMKVTGFTLKQCHSMNRLEAILEYLYQLDSLKINWVDIATNFNFSDQPHLIRYLKSLIGLTPGEYSRKRDFTIDVYGDFK